MGQSSACLADLYRNTTERALKALSTPVSKQYNHVHRRWPDIPYQPANGQAITTVAAGSQKDVDIAVAAAKKVILPQHSNSPRELITLILVRCDRLIKRLGG